jgi:hypothetical protein
MTTVMPIDEPRPRGTVLGERTDGRRVPEAEHFFPMQGVQRLDRCAGFGFEDHEAPLPHPAQDQAQ